MSDAGIYEPTPDRRALTEARLGVDVAPLEEGQVPARYLPAVGNGLLVDSLRQPGDTDNAVWARAIEALKAKGGGTLTATPDAVYMLTSSIDLDGLEGVQIDGNGSTLVAAPTVAGIYPAFAMTHTLSGTYGAKNASGRYGAGLGGRDIHLFGFNVDGGLTNLEAIEGKLARNGDGESSDGGDGRRFALGQLSGLLRVISTFNSEASLITDAPVIENVSVRDCYIFGTSGLPVFLTGVYGSSRVTDNHIERCLDTGFTFCEDVLFANNVVRWSADNGVSASRGCSQVSVIANNIYGCWFNGVWVAGFEGDRAPSNVIVLGNNIEYVAQAGIYANGGPEGLTVVGNSIKRVLRGPRDTSTSTSYGVGLYVGGYQDAALVWHDATAVVISGNRFSDIARLGVFLGRNIYDLTATGNTFHNVGSALLEDGSPVPEDGTSNVGFFCGTSLYVKRVLISANQMTSDQTQVVGGATLPVSHAFSSHPTISSWHERGNIAYGVRTAIEEVWTTSLALDGLRLGGPLDPDSRITFDGNAAAARLLLFTTAGVNRWKLAMASDTKFVLDAYSDDGSTFVRVMDFDRTSKAVTFSNDLSAAKITATELLSSGITSSRGSVYIGTAVGAATIRLSIDGTAATPKLIEFKDDGVIRATVRLINGVFKFTSYTAGGASTDTLSVDAATNAWTFTRPPKVPSATNLRTVYPPATYGANSLCLHTPTNKLAVSTGTDWVFVDGSGPVPA